MVFPATIQRNRNLAIARSAARTLAAQDIGPIPPVANLPRRQAADGSFRAFCDSYFPKIFYLPWSKDHLRVIGKIERTVLHGERFAVAMPRGFGKSNLCEIAALWAILTGRHQFVILISATAEYASKSLDNIKTHLSGNALLLEDYPEAVYPIQKLEGESRRCGGQRYYGRLTHIEWNADQIVLPTIPGSRCSGAIVQTSGITGNIRGAKHVSQSQTCERPSLVIVDDPQTDDSARSFEQTRQRLGIITHAIRLLGGPGKPAAVIIPCTVIQPGDLADQLLDRQAHPEWHGERTKMVYRFPANEKLWTEYAKLRIDSLRADGNAAAATEFYKTHRDEMDAGAEVAWPERCDPGEISGLQHAMNLKLEDPAMFFAEYQNEPLAEVGQADDSVPAEAIRAKLNLLPRGAGPIAAQHLTAAIDVHDEILYWLVCAWADGFSGWVVDYGAWPDQRRAFWQHDKPPVTLSRRYPGMGAEAMIRQSLLDLADHLCGKSWLRQDSGEMRLERVLVDAGFRPDQVCDVCRNSPHAAVLLPSRGVGIGPTRRPMAEYVRRPGDRLGWHWYLTPPQRGLRFVHLDVNHWKTFLQARWRTAVGDLGALSLFGREPQVHEMLAVHLAAEIPTRVTANGRTVEQWAPRPGPDVAHWLDCLVMNAAAGSLCGVTLPGGDAGGRGLAKPCLKLSELQQRRAYR